MTSRSIFRNCMTDFSSTFSFCFELIAPRDLWCRLENGPMLVRYQKETIDHLRTSDTGAGKDIHPVSGPPQGPHLHTQQVSRSTEGADHLAADEGGQGLAILNRGFLGTFKLRSRQHVSFLIHFQSRLCRLGNWLRHARFGPVHGEPPSRLRLSCAAVDEKKPTWSITLGCSTTSVYSSTGLLAQPGCPSSSHPTNSNRC